VAICLERVTWRGPPCPIPILVCGDESVRRATLRRARPPLRIMLRAQTRRTGRGFVATLRAFLYVFGVGLQGLHLLVRGQLCAVACHCIVFLSLVTVCVGGISPRGVGCGHQGVRVHQRRLIYQTEGCCPRGASPYWPRCPVWWASRRFACVQVEGVSG